MDELKVVERVLVEPGYRHVYKPAGEDVPVESHETSRLSALKKGQRVRARVSTRHAALERGMTEAELLRLMEEKGVGRPSTYAGIVAELVRRKYVRANGRLRSTGRGRRVWAFLAEHYSYLFSPSFTAHLERSLDGIASGEASYFDVLGELWDRLPEQKENYRPGVEKEKCTA